MHPDRRGQSYPPLTQDEGGAIASPASIRGLAGMYERLCDRLIPAERFLWRLTKHVLCVLGLLALSVLAGALGFMSLEGYGIEDAILHSAHILAGLGLIQLPGSYAGRLFVALFGLYASLFFLAAFSIIFAPVVHRILHRLHLDDDG